MTTAPPVARTPDLGSPKWAGRVLIVEDDVAQLQTLTDILHDEGFHVHGCPTGASALRYLDNAPPMDVAVVDLRLPDVDGNQLLDEIRKRDDEIRVIIHTGYGSFGSAKEAVNSGAFAYVEKLGNPDELVRHVHRAVTQRVHQSNLQLEAAVAARTAELQESESRLRAIVESAADAILVIDEHERIDTFNSAAERMFGYTAAETRGKKLSHLLPDPVSPDGGKTLTDYLRGGSVTTLHLVDRELTARASRMIDQAVTGDTKPFKACGPSAASLNAAPNSTRVDSATTTPPGSAKACSRAARFGVSPTTPRSRASPSPISAPTTTRPVAMPARASSG